MINELTRFKRVADIGSITKASKTLWITQPALSQSLQRLEKELGYELFSQNGKRISLTPQGETFYEICSKIIQWWEKAKSLKNSIEFPPTYSIGLFDSAALILSPFLQKKIKDTKIEIIIDRSENLLRKLNNNLLDFCICIVPKNKDVFVNLEIVKSWEEKLIPVTGSLYKNPPEEIPFIMHAKDSVTQKYIDREFLKAGIVPKVIIESINPMFTKDLAIKNHGVAFLPESMVGNDIKKKKLFVQKISMQISRTCAIFKHKQPYPKEKEDFLREIITKFN